MPCDYHPTQPTRDKIKYCASIRLDDIPAFKIMDPIFWTIMFSLWMKEPGEYHKGQVIYDVLLPWLVDGLLPSAIARSASDPCAEWKTVSRSGTGFYGAVIEAVRYSLRSRGLTKEQTKQFKYALRREILDKLREDLCVMSDPEGSLHDGLVLGFDPAPAPDGQGQLPDHARLLITGKSYIRRIDGEVIQGRTLSDATIGLFFSGGWCKPCKQFASLLAYAHRNVKERGQKFVVIFVSRCKSQTEFDEYFATMPPDWLAIPYSNGADRRDELARIFSIRSIPSLAVINSAGHVFTLDGVSAIRSDLDCEAFPWTPAALAAAQAAKGPPSLPTHAAMLIRWACENVSAKALKEQQAGRLHLNGIRELQISVDRIRRLCLTMKGGRVFDDVSYIACYLQNQLDVESEVSAELCPRFELIANQDSIEHYAGDSLPVSNPKPIDLISLPRTVTSPDQALRLLKQYIETCNALLTRARDTSTTSRLALQYEVLVLISELFTQVLPQPKTFFTFEKSFECKSDIWSTPVPHKLQVDILKCIYKLVLVYGTMWQAIEVSPRCLDCERTVVAACIFTIFDAVLRRPACDVPMALSVMLSDNGGYKLSANLCQSNVDFIEIFSHLELSQPHLIYARESAMAYIQIMNRTCKHELLTLRQPDQIELKKYGTTMLFLRNLISRLGYEFIARDARRQPPEMEILVEWFCGEDTKLAHENPEWAMTRDMVAIFKFLSTMDTREAELMRQRKMKQQFLWWQFSFEEGGRRAWWGRLSGKPLSWEAVNFRGIDLDTANLEVRGFGDRKLLFGEGPATQSPSDVGKILSLEFPSEDDVLYCDRLPMYGSTLSREESEQIMSYLTVEYTRIPLILGFFASKDRVTYLFNNQLRSLLRSVLFEGGHWIPNAGRHPINEVPLRFTKQQAEEEQVRRLLGGKRKNEQENLGTSYGLLYNELVVSPHACLAPFLDMLQATKPLHHASVYSRDASFLCYIILLAIDMEAYLLNVRKQLLNGTASRPFLSGELAAKELTIYEKKLDAFLRGDMARLLSGWGQETDDKGDIVTSCVVMSYNCLLYANCEGTMSDTALVQFLSSFLYVRSWHGFGLGLLASQLDAGDLDESLNLTPEDRLIRFLQAHGVDTARIKKEDLTKYLKGRPLYLHVGGQSIRAPSLLRQNGKQVTCLPPADVPEQRLFVAYSKQRRYVCERFAQYFASNSLTGVLSKVLRIALRSPQFSDQTWEAFGPGRYKSIASELKLDLQTGEVFWRNDDLQPVPDSIAQFSDYQTLFRDKSLHCGIVARQSHRYWIHLVGTEYDLIEWDEPQPENQGWGGG